MIRLDHFIYGVPELGRAMDDFAGRTGVRPEWGGQHPSLGTRNALVSLGDEAYLELLAVDSTLSVKTNPILDRLRKIATFTFFGWALRCDDFGEVATQLEKYELRLSSIGSGSRVNPAGVLLKYEFADIVGAESTAPFFVRWIETVHPSQTAPRGCNLDSLQLVSPRRPLGHFLGSLKLGIEFSVGARSQLELGVRSPQGPILF